MPPIFKGEIPLILDDGRAFTLTFDHETLFAAERSYGAMHVLLANLQADHWGAIRAFLFAALQPKHPDVTLEACSRMLLDGELPAIQRAIVGGLKAAMPDATEDRDGENPPRPRRAGTSAGRSGVKSASTPMRSGQPRRAHSS